MSAHATLTAIEQEAEAFCRQRFTDQASYLEAKDSHCKAVRRLVRQLRRQIGVPEMLSFGTGRRTFGGRSFSVELRMPRARKAG
jgi:P2-related tail formation protein